MDKAKRRFSIMWFTLGQPAKVSEGWTDDVPQGTMETTKDTKQTKERQVNEMTEPIYKDECYGIMGACFEVYKELGCGFLESVYQESLEIDWRCRRYGSGLKWSWPYVIRDDC